MNRQPYIAFACSYCKINTEHPFAKGVCYEAFTLIQ
uniref:RNA synthesis protein n=2 Tax=unclassified Caudoviricetes TaxID=2788787 RepID=A0A8S5VAP9_9CAUD|nr:MAG TPA: RNA synthesis protein [Siphoviridae sp. ctfrT39]DAG03850.1 MAG TPA: RNA synthesis protein [Siphoviridae sp. ct0vA12]